LHFDAYATVDDLGIPCGYDSASTLIIQRCQNSFARSIANRIHALSMKKPELKTAPIAVRVVPSIKAALDKLARAEHRSTSSLIELALAQFIERETGKRGAGQ
jgi:hypothetical protein